MKTISQVAQAATLSVAAIMLFGLGARPAHSQTQQEAHSQGSTDCGLGEPHPILDLAGYLRDDLSTLFVMSGMENPVLRALNARPIGVDQFEVDIPLGDGTTITVSFGLQRVQLPAAFLPAQDGPTPVTDAKVYKNARCAVVENALAIGCGPYLDGNSATLEYLPRKKCKSGTDFCVETSVVYWIRKVYSDALCRQLIDINTGKDNMCQ